MLLASEMLEPAPVVVSVRSPPIEVKPRVNGAALVRLASAPLPRC